MISTYIRIAMIAGILGVITFIGFKFNELKNKKIEIIELRAKQTELEIQLDLNQKIMDDVKTDFITYQIEEDIAIQQEDNITKQLTTKEYTYKNVFKLIGE